MPEAVADVLQHLSNLPPFPKVTAKLLTMLDDDTVSVEDLASVISADPSLAVKVIHLSNSPFYMVTRPVESVKDALFVLGLSSIKNMTVGVSLQKGLSAVQPRSETFNMLDFWKHSYATAIVASKLGSREGRKLGDTLYLAGLIHDVGKMILAYYWPDVWKAIYTIHAKSNEPFCDVEERMFSKSHAAIAAELLANWKFPPLIVQLVEYHHTEPTPGMTIDVGKSTLRIANALVNASGYAFPPGSYGPSTVNISQYQDITATLDVELEHQLKVLNA